MRYWELFEGRDAPLYHGASFFGGNSIIQDNAILPKTWHKKNKLLIKNAPHQENTEIRGVSLSRNSNMAFSFGPVVFVIDQRKLSQTNRIIPINYWKNEKLNTRNPSNNQNMDYEYEEFCIGAIKPLERYLIEILIKKMEPDSPRFKNFETFPQLMKHPKLKII